MQLFFFNTKTRKKEFFTPMNDPQVRMYTCGPTVYNYAHIGNFRTYVFEDLLRRSLRFFGKEVTQVMNLTDVDDKTIRESLKSGLTLDEYTKKFKKAFFADCEQLCIQKVEHYPAATDYITEMIAMVSTLLEKKVAYQGEDRSVYFSIESFPNYGTLSHLNQEDLQKGASGRMDSDEYEKGHVADFVLWKAYDEKRDGAVYWDSPFGKGRPGWHIECSAMARAILGDSIDMHCGGVDNIFPHHENEIAQTECCTGETFAKYWLHAEHLLVDNKKMSKSAGNFYTLRDLLQKGYRAEEVRYLLSQTHYRKQLNFTLEGLEGARSALRRVQDFVQRLKELQEGKREESFSLLCEETLKDFSLALADDLNVPEALGVLFSFIRKVNGEIDQGKLGKQDGQKALSLLKQMNEVLAVLPLSSVEEKVPEEVMKLAKERELARKERNWAQADALRDRILTLGYIAEDSPSGMSIKKQ